FGWRTGRRFPGTLPNTIRAIQHGATVRYKAELRAVRRVCLELKCVNAEEWTYSVEPFPVSF
ncbi:MAG TPA: hypothetical protein VN761_11175, partial [Candidatus Polarisedimenticolia bacterium]|nr:hypothetical protein [Candidatus Polarisedimenticolia bacterium]